MLGFGEQTENSTHIRDNLKAETPQLNNAKRKLGLRDLNIQQHVHVQSEIMRPSKTLVPEKVYKEACEKFCAYEDKGCAHTEQLLLQMITVIYALALII
ncbi:unnamed protein product [Schistosoma margrebowiei]|uniref:Uncharacterized protein n=1 Tax=Schistosoma margrebowiei TaxID=48269 RepID=A0AA85A4Q8_9TREM|nr:unnamed protein product [Schistosoma margrebowiei]